MCSNKQNFDSFDKFNFIDHVCILMLFLQFHVDHDPSLGYTSLAAGVGSLKIIETNPFKHLTHLSLNLAPGNDTDVKKYLASCLKVSLVSVFNCV